MQAGSLAREAVASATTTLLVASNSPGTSVEDIALVFSRGLLLPRHTRGEALQLAKGVSRGA